MSARDHSLYQEEVGAYLLDALTPLEGQAFERHMVHCPNCRDEVERLRPAADALPRSVEQLTPPPALKTALMEVVDREAEEAGAESARPAPRKRRRLGALLRPVFVAGALAVGVAGGFGIARLSETEEQPRVIAAQVDEQRIPQATARLVVQGEGENAATLRVQGMPSLRPNQVYQAWVARDSTFVPQPTFEVGADGGAAVAIPDDLTGADQILVTRESRGGARAPGEAPILSVGL